MARSDPPSRTLTQPLLYLFRLSPLVESGTSKSQFQQFCPMYLVWGSVLQRFRASDNVNPPNFVSLSFFSFSYAVLGIRPARSRCILAHLLQSYSCLRRHLRARVAPMIATGLATLARSPDVRQVDDDGVLDWIVRRSNPSSSSPLREANVVSAHFDASSTISFRFSHSRVA